MTPLGFARSLADDLATLPLPREVHAQLGEIVVPCAGTYVSITSLSEVDPTGPNGNDCGLILMADVTVIAARDCANVSNEDGTTNWKQQDAVSAQMDIDGAILWDWAEKQRADTWFRTTPPTLTYTITGGLAMTILGVTLPVP